MQSEEFDNDFGRSVLESQNDLHKFNQSELNNLGRDLNMPKIAAEILTSRHKEKKCLFQTQTLHFIEKGKNLNILEEQIVLYIVAT